MKLLARYVILLALSLSALALVCVFVAERLTLSWFLSDLDIRAKFASSAIHDSLVTELNQSDKSRLHALFSRLKLDERLYAVAFCDEKLDLAYRTEQFPRGVHCPEVSSWIPGKGQILRTASGPLHVARLIVEENGNTLGQMIVVHDLSFVERRSAKTRRYIFGFFLVLGSVISALTVALGWWSWRSRLEEIRRMIATKGELEPTASGFSKDVLPVLNDLRALVAEFESQQQLRGAVRVDWNPGTLKEVLKSRLAGDQILVVSNREPYIHLRTDGTIRVQVPASGLVTALEPVMRACSGIWIAHGSGPADREVVDEDDKLWVPPGEHSYQVRRIWLTEEEETGYYYGFANEGLWPLCHIAHVRPIFRNADWLHYKLVNERFADAVVKEAMRDDPVVLVQDFHFALLPAMIRKRLPRATVISFWHIPWPNPEAFGICPWREEILRGLLGSTIMGFHTRFHCNNFIATVDRFMECRIDRERQTISHRGKLTAVRSYPISIEWPPKVMGGVLPAEECGQRVRERHGLAPGVQIGLGVDRLDYTKGILERFHAFERMLELFPQWIGKVAFIQIAAPSRSKLASYRQFASEVVECVKRINERFSELAGFPPIVLVEEHLDPPVVYEYYRAASFCLVTSLHDGMNLVAKEFVSARDDELGVLILSMFTGASRELPEALLVNPYNLDVCAQTIHQALSMPPEEQRARLASMRKQIGEFNVFRWAGRMLIDAAEVRERNRLQDDMTSWGEPQQAVLG